MMRSFLTRRLVLVATAGLLSAACDKSTAPARPGPPTRLEVTGGAGQVALAGTALAQSISVTVRDAKGMAVPNASVNFAVVEGGGFVTPSSVVSDAAGLASGVSWTLGTRGGSQTVTATIDTVVKRISATIRSSFPLDLRFFGPPMSAEAQAAFTNAANRLRAAIITQISTVALQNTDVSQCGVSGLTGSLTENTAGIIIFASVAAIDGAGKILAQAGPCFVRNTTTLPVVGAMQFDEADIQNYITSGRFESIVLHEMNHVFGFGTIWTDKHLLSNAAFTDEQDPKPTGNTNPRFTGTATLASCLGAGGLATHCAAGVGVAVEMCGGPGTADGHWREMFTATCGGTNNRPVGGTPAFGAELMTGYAESTPNMPWSAMSISQFQDLGYSVNLLAADPYNVPSLLALARMSLQDAVAGDHPLEVVRRPKFTVTSSGRVQAINREQKR